MTLHFDSTTRAVRDVAADIVFASGMCLSMIGHFDAGGRLMRLTTADSEALDDPAVTMRVAAVLAQGHRASDAIEISDGLIAAGRITVAKILLPLAVVPSAYMLEEPAKIMVGSALNRLAGALEESDRLGAAAAHYSAGNWHFSCNDYEQALSQYRKAAEYDPTYEGAGYFQAELAAAFV